MFEVNNRNTGIRYEICSKLTIKIVNFEENASWDITNLSKIFAWINFVSDN